MAPKENEAIVRSAIQTYGDNTYIETDKGLNARLDFSGLAFYEGIWEYDPNVFENIFLMWYFVIHSTERELKTLGHDGKLNPIACRLLLERALGRNEKTQQIKRDIEEYGLEAAQVSEKKRILDEYLNRLHKAENLAEMTIRFHVKPPELISEPVPPMSCGSDNAYRQSSILGQMGGWAT